MFTDIHTHAFHPKIARHAVEHLNEAYQLDCVGEGTIADLLLREKRSGIGRCVVLCAATTPGQVVPANDYAVTLQREHPEVTAFGTLHPGYEAWESQLERLKAAGIRGLKLHPDFQHFWLDDPRLLPMFEAAQDDFIFLFHIGDNVPPEKNPSCPYKLAALLDRFPRSAASPGISAGIISGNTPSRRSWGATCGWILQAVPRSSSPIFSRPFSASIRRIASCSAAITRCTIRATP